jgi:hypothetical protein
MTEVVVLLSIVVGAGLFGGGIVVGVWVSRFVTTGEMPVFRPKPQPVEREVAVPVYEPAPLVESPPLRAPPAKPQGNGGSAYRYDAATERESSENFYRLQERIAAQQAGGPYSEQYTAGL